MILSPLNRSVKMSSPLEKHFRHDREEDCLDPTIQTRLVVLNALERSAMRMREAAMVPGLSVRQVRRLRRGYRTHGPAALVHGNRGRPSPRRLSDKLRLKILTLARTTYAGVNDHHLTELLREREHLHLSRITIRRLLRQAGIGSPRSRRPPRHRRRRERMPQAGLLIQITPCSLTGAFSSSAPAPAAAVTLDCVSTSMRIWMAPSPCPTAANGSRLSCFPAAISPHHGPRTDSLTASQVQIPPLPAYGAQSTRKAHTPPADHPWRWGAEARARRKQLHLQGEGTFS